MCEECIQIAADIDPKLMKIVESVMDEMAALHAKIALQMREIMEMTITNADTGETPEEGDVPDEVIAEIDAVQTKIAGMMGLTYAAAWFNVRQANSPMEGHMMGESIMKFTHKAIEEASAYNYVVNQVRH